MKTAGATVGALLVDALAAICCALVALIAAIGTTTVAAWLSYSGYVLIAATLIAVGGGVLWARHRRISAKDCCQSETLKKVSGHE